jgi:hypothetical protein
MSSAWYGRSKWKTDEVLEHLVIQCGRLCEEKWLGHLAPRFLSGAATARVAASFMKMLHGGARAGLESMGCERGRASRFSFPAHALRRFGDRRSLGEAYPGMSGWRGRNRSVPHGAERPAPRVGASHCLQGSRKTPWCWTMEGEGGALKRFSFAVHRHAPQECGASLPNACRRRNAASSSFPPSFPRFPARCSCTGKYRVPLGCA